MRFDDYYIRDNEGQPAKREIPAPKTRAEMRMDDDGGSMLPTGRHDKGCPKIEVARIPKPTTFTLEELAEISKKIDSPDNNPKTAYGLKKPPLLSCVPASALLVEGQVMALGARKYGPFNWREKSVAASVYIDAAIRHILDWNAGVDLDPESGVSHLGHVRACMGILIDAMENGCLIDDRPKDEATPRLLRDFTKQ